MSGGIPPPFPLATLAPVSFSVLVIGRAVMPANALIHVTVNMPGILPSIILRSSVC